MAQSPHPPIVLASSGLDYILIKATLNRLFNRRLRIGFLKAGEGAGGRRWHLEILALRRHDQC